MDQSVPYGDTASFTVTATSGTALSYQWYKDGLLGLDTLLPGQTSSNLTIVNVGLLDPGTYYVEVKNAGGTVASRHATLSAVLLNTRPVANNDSYTTLEDVPLNIPAPGVLANDTDADGNTMTAVLVSPVKHGNLSLNSNGSFSYTPNTNYNGTDSFTYAAHDGAVTGNVATVSINLTPVNNPPIAINDFVSVKQNESVEVRVLDNDIDPEGDDLTVIAAVTTNGTAVVNNSGSGGRVRFTPAPNFYGMVVFNYTVSDGTLSATGSVTVTVIRVNHDPVANNDEYVTLNTGSLTIPAGGVLTNDLDSDGDPLTALLASNVSHGTLVLNPDGSFTYTPNDSYVGNDMFTYQAYDGTAASAVATVTISVRSNSPLTLTPMGMTANGFELMISGSPVAGYIIEASTNLTDWIPVSTNAGFNGPPMSSGAAVFTDTEASKFSQRYYRALSR